jgi:aspartate-semialdehyde dehydrogenase
MKIAVVGATGLVGREMLKTLEERNFPLTELLPVASERSAGKRIVFRGKEYPVISMAEAIARKPVIALFSAGGETSKIHAPEFAKLGTTVIDNSSAWRMESGIKLVVPEVNASLLTRADKIIANPNCSTIQMVLVLAPLHLKYGLKRVVVSTYQSVTGTGQKALDQLHNERKGIEGAMAYPYRIDLNCIPQCDVFTDNGYTKEEMKMVNETRKILGDDTIGITATTVRVPVVGGHSEAVNLEFEKDFEVEEVRRLLSNTSGVIVMDDPAALKYPMPLIASGKDEVFVGRIRRDHSAEKCLNLWIVADNLRKGAATNAIQIAEYLLESKLV